MNKGLSALALILAILLAGCGEGGKSVDESAYKPYLLPGARARHFEARNMDNKYLTFSRFQGKVTLMTFWRKRCEECVKNLDILEKLYQRFKDRNFTIIALNGDNLNYVPSSKVIEFVKEKGYTYTVLLDDQFIATRAYKVIKIPTTFLIDKEGIIRHIEQGEVNWTTPENIERIEKLL